MSGTTIFQCCRLRGDGTAIGGALATAAILPLETFAVPELLAARAGDGWGTSSTTATVLREESLSRFSRFRSARKSAACCLRKSRSFSSDLLIMRSSSAGIAGLRRFAPKSFQRLLILTYAFGQKFQSDKAV